MFLLMRSTAFPSNLIKNIKQRLWYFKKDSIIFLLGISSEHNIKIVLQQISFCSYIYIYISLYLTKNTSEKNIFILQTIEVMTQTFHSSFNSAKMLNYASGNRSESFDSLVYIKTKKVQMMYTSIKFGKDRSFSSCTSSQLNFKRNVKNELKTSL